MTSAVTRPGESASPSRTDPLDCPPHVVGELVRELLSRGDTATFPVLGVSMHPTIREGDRVVLAALEGGVARPGDVIAFARASCLCLHRVLSVRRERDGTVAGYVTGGDGLLADDGFQPASSVTGRVVEVRGSRGVWSPAAWPHPFVSSIRVCLGKRPRLRAALREARRAFHRLSGLAGPREGSPA